MGLWTEEIETSVAAIYHMDFHEALQSHMLWGGIEPELDMLSALSKILQAYIQTVP